MSVKAGSQIPLVTRGLISLYDTSNVKNYLLSEVEVLVVAGGGSGGNCKDNSGTPAGGGGGGGVLYSSSYKVTPGSAISVTVGNGGATQTLAGKAGNNGQNSLFGLLNAVGGGGGGGDDSTSPYGSGENTRRRGNNGGSGGGSGNTTTNRTAGVAGQGFGGGGSDDGAGGGGGAGGPGSDSPWMGISGKGGNGLPFNISGTLTYYAGGGGGGGYISINAGPGGLGGGGRGANRQASTTSNGQNGIDGLGSGGGGGAANQGFTSNGGAGGKGVVIVRYPGPQKASGGDLISMKNGYTIHTFNNSGTFTPFSTIPANNNAIYGIQDFYGTNSGYSAGGTTYSTLGGGSFEFDGTDDRIIIANPSTGGVPEELFLNDSDITIFCAVYPRTPIGAVTYFTLRGEGDNELDFGTANTSNLVLRFDRFPPGGGGAGGSVALIKNQWNIVAVSAKHGVQARFFVNNVFETVAHTEIYSGRRPTWATIGAQTTNNGSTFIRPHNGYISHMMIYNRALDDDEILQNYNSIRARFGL
jgi:hypothetical protein